MFQTADVEKEMTMFPLFKTILVSKSISFFLK